MSQRLQDSPAKIVRQWLINLAMGVNSTAKTAVWPVYAISDPDLPDRVLVVKNTSPVLEGSSQITGEYYQAYGIQITVRARTEEEGWDKANDVDRTLCIQRPAQHVIVTTPTGSRTYCVWAWQKEGGVIYLGDDTPTTKRQLLTINGLVRLTKVS